MSIRSAGSSMKKNHEHYEHEHVGKVRQLKLCRCELWRANDVWFRLLFAGFGCSGITGANPNQTDVVIQMQSFHVPMLSRFFSRQISVSRCRQIGTYLVTVYGVVVGGGSGPKCRAVEFGQNWPRMVEKTCFCLVFCFFW